jgi:hypothetical protein
MAGNWLYSRSSLAEFLGEGLWRLGLDFQQRCQMRLLPDLCPQHRLHPPALLVLLGRDVPPEGLIAKQHSGGLPFAATAAALKTFVLLRLAQFDVSKTPKNGDGPRHEPRPK